eukprot:COSAG04_NODE_3053_length_3233_cov_17.496490_1_plen_481_part_00
MAAAAAMNATPAYTSAQGAAEGAVAVPTAAVVEAPAALASQRHAEQAAPPVQRCCCVACGAAAQIVLQLAFAMFMSFMLLFGQTGNTVSRGWSVMLGGLWCLAAVECLATCAVLSGSAGERVSAGTYARAAVSAAASALSAALLLAFLGAVLYDYSAKCSDEEQLQERWFSVAHPFNCTPGGELLAIWNALYVFCFLIVPKAAIMLLSCTTCCWHRKHLDDARAAGLQQALLPGTDEQSPGWVSLVPAAVLGLLTAAAGAAALSGLFLSGVKDAAGTCPTAANFTGQAQAIAEKIFRPAPLTGIELPDCGWRTSQGGSCVLYPYDFASFNRTYMTDPMDGRYTQSESSGDGNNLCTDLLGLFSCATYSPDVGRFLTGMALANEPIAGPDYNYRTPINFRIRVCEDFCVRLFGVCAGLNTSEGGVCAGAATPTDCCTQTFAGVTVVDSTDDCWNAGGRAQPGLAALTFAVCVLLATQQVYS